MNNNYCNASAHKKLINSQLSSFEKYKDLFVGRNNLFFFLKYELIVSLFSSFPGGIGYFLRKIFYPLICNRIGKGVVLGRNLTIRHPHKITIGENSYIDDNVVLDAKGKDNQGIVIGKNVYIGRNTIISCKEGSIIIGDFTNISGNCYLLSETHLKLGEYCFLAGQCYLVAGGNHSYKNKDVPIMFQPSYSKGGIEIGDDVWLGAGVIVLDGVKIKKGCVVGAGAVIKDSFDEYSVLAGVPAKIIGKR